MQIITEDSETKSKYKEFYYHVYGKENVIFAFGNANVVKYISSSDENTKCVAVIDLVYDNMETVVAFSRLVDICKRRKLKNVTLAPVICSEYTELLTMREFGFVEDKLILDILDFKESYSKLDTSYSVKGVKSFEKACKHMVGKSRKMQFYEYAKSNMDAVSRAFLRNQGHYYGASLVWKDSVSIAQGVMAKSILYASVNKYDDSNFLKTMSKQISILMSLKKE